MRLDTYLLKHGITSARFAEMLGVGHKQTVHNYRHGIRFPTPENMRRIEEVTGKSVTAQDFLAHHAERSSDRVSA